MRSRTSSRSCSGSVARSSSASGSSRASASVQQRVDVPARHAAELVRDHEQLGEQALAVAPERVGLVLELGGDLVRRRLRLPQPITSQESSIAADGCDARGGGSESGSSNGIVI